MGVTQKVLGRACVALLVLAIVPETATAQKKKKDPVAGEKEAKASGVTAITTIHPEQGFVDDAFAFDGSGGRLAFVRADAASFAEIEVLDLAQAGAQLARFDVSKATTSIVWLGFTVEGNLVAISRPADDENGKVTAFAFDLKGKQLRKWGPATDIAFSLHEGVDVVAVYNRGKADKKNNVTHDVAVFRVDTGKAMGKKRTFKADAAGRIKALDLTFLYWRHGYTQLVGQKKGEYDKYEDQRQPDNEGVYDVIEGQMVKSAPIADLIAHEKLVKLRVDRQNQDTFLVVTEDLRGLELVTPDDKRVPVATSEAFSHYDIKTLVFEPGRDGKVYFSLTIDPVNPDAVARKVADVELIDLFVTDAAGGTARRLARLPKGKVPHAWHTAGGRWGVLRKHKGYDRGGPDLEIYELNTP